MNQKDDDDIKVASVFCKYLSVIGMYAPIGKKRSLKRLLFVFIYFQVSGMGMLGFSIYYLKRYKFNLDAMGDPIAGVTSLILSFSMQVSFLFPDTGLNQLLQDLGDFSDHEMPKDYLENLRKINKYSKSFIMILITILILTWLVLLLENCEDDVVEICGLLVSTWYPINVYFTPARQLYMTIQTLSAYHNGTTSCVILGVYASIIKCLVMHIEHLQEMFLLIPKLNGRDNRKEQIKKCVLYHYRIIEYRNRCARSARPTFFYLLFFSSIVISLTSFQCLAFELRIQVVLHLSVYLIFATINCYFGESLIKASDDLLFTVYESMPFDDDHLTASDLRFIMLCSSKGISIPAGKIGTVGHMRLMDMLSKSYSYLTMLLNMQ